MRTRRVKLNAQQMLTKNVSEAIVDKDNHARDAMKYVLMSLPEPAIASAHEELRQELKQLAEAGDLTSAYIRSQQATAEESGDQPPPRGAYLRYLILTGYRG
jgi:hypothetical protein